MNAIASYPAGTPLAEVEHFDRSMKIAFHCPEHPSTTWMSKDPWLSRWFPDVPLGAVYEVCREAACEVPLRNWTLVRDYRPTRNG
jgi:hypothetical protein